MAGPQVKIKVGADLTPAQKAVDDFQAQTAAAAKKSGDNLAAGIEGGAQKAGAALKGVGSAADRTASATEGMLKLDKVMKFTAALGAAKNAFDTINKSVGVADEHLTKAIDQTAGLTMQGAQMGAAFGPWGAVIGAALGAIVGIGLAIKDWLKDSKQLEISNGIIDRHTGYVAHNIHEAWGFARDAAEATSPMVQYFRDIKEHTKGWAEWLALAVAQVDIVKQLAELDKAEPVVGEKKKTLQDKKDELSAAEALGKFYEKQHAAGVIFDAEEEANAVKTIARIKTARLDLKAALDEEVQGQDKATKATVDHTDAIKAQADAFDALMASEQGAANRALVIAENQAAAAAQARRTVADIGAHGASGHESRVDPNDAILAKIKAKIAADDKAAATAAALDQGAIEQAKFDASVSRYASYADAVLSITSALTAQLEANVAAGASPFAHMGLAAEQGVSQTLKALGKLWTAQGIAEFATGLADVFSPNPIKKAEAAGHFLSAAEYGAAAAAAGVGGALTGGDASRRQTAADATEKDAEGAGGGGGASTSGGNASYAGGSTYQELPQMVYNLAPGGTVVFAGDNRGRAEYGRYTTSAQQAGAKATPTLGR